MKKWNDEMIAVAKDLWDKGYSATQVADAINRQFSTGFTRNAVVGKLFRSDAMRKGTPGRANGDKKPPKTMHRSSGSTPRKLAPKGYTVASAKRAVQKKMEKTEAPQLTLTKELDPATNVDLMGLEEGMCKWPVSDTLFCGSPIVMRRKSYCSIHNHQSGDRLRQARADGNFAARRVRPTRGRFF